MGPIRGSTSELLLIVQQLCSGWSKWVLTFRPSAWYTFFYLEVQNTYVILYKRWAFSQSILSACCLIAMLMTLLILWIWRTGKPGSLQIQALQHRLPVLSRTHFMSHNYTYFERKKPHVSYHILQLCSRVIEKNPSISPHLWIRDHR